MNITRMRTATASFLTCVMLGACAQVGETYKRPKISAPVAWERQTPLAQAGAWPDRLWWESFGIAELDRLIAEAQANNHDLRAAAARIMQARATLRLAGAELYPTLAIAADARRNKQGEAAAGSSFGVGPRASYEIDIWGRTRSTGDAASALVLSSVYAREALKLGLTADVANAYFLMLSLNDRIRAAQDNAANARRLLSLVEVQRRAGRVSDLEIARQREQLASTEAVVPSLVQQRQVAQGALAVLLGRNYFGLPEAGAQSLRAARLPAVPAGLPSQIVERRPDIRRAEEDLIGANANIGAARAALFPRLTLSGEGGWRSNAVASLVSSGTSFYSIGFDVLATIFDGGKLRGRVDFAIARKAELAEAYQQSILLAFREVEDALSGIEQFALQEDLQQQAVAHAREAYRLADVRYKAGAVDFTTILDAQRTLLSNESAVDSVRLGRFSSLVSLYRALGGGWEDPGTAAAAITAPAR